MWINPDSSNVVAYCYEGSTLLVRFKTGSYAYWRVPAKLFEELQEAESVGKFLNKEVKGKFEYTKL